MKPLSEQQRNYLKVVISIITDRYHPHDIMALTNSKGIHWMPTASELADRLKDICNRESYDENDSIMLNCLINHSVILHSITSFIGGNTCTKNNNTIYK